jgi:hypothetical protein
MVLEASQLFVTFPLFNIFKNYNSYYSMEMKYVCTVVCTFSMMCTET